MTLARIPTWFFVITSVTLGFIASLMMVVAFSTASLRFAHCGPSDLSSPEQYCRGAAQLIIAGYAVFSASVVFAAAVVWLWFKRRGRL
jgi:hypothetical protein